MVIYCLSVGLAFVAVNAYGGNGHHYIIRFKGWIGRCIKQARYYLIGIMKGEPHPFEANEQSKFNPLQQAAYTAVMYGFSPSVTLQRVLLFISNVRVRNRCRILDAENTLYSGSRQRGFYLWTFVFMYHRRYPDDGV
ncbi:thiosulfate reductase cytochrome B subunit [Budvicia aquatica]|uniref:Thiosulfate reductase cytochrome B subunit n=1 Tax=Budvicia aquatica TaxID=82979 RepID=A0A484ZM81_9GAMM|nr:thiosulfate reductase cytochrome B subunit [Budvicia aquatica]